MALKMTLEEARQILKKENLECESSEELILLLELVNWVSGDFERKTLGKTFEELRV